MIFLEPLVSIILLFKLVSLPLFAIVQQVLFTQFLIVYGLIDEAWSLAKAHTLVFGDFLLAKLPEVSRPLLLYHH